MTAKVASCGLPPQSVKGPPPEIMLFEIVEEVTLTPPSIILLFTVRGLLVEIVELIAAFSNLEIEPV